MAEDFEQQSSGDFNLQHYLGVARRRHLQFLIPLLLGWLVVWGASWILPERYKSGTLILVEQPTMPKDYVTPNVNDNLQDRLQSITQQILSRTRLLQIIDQLNLYGGSNSQIAPDDKVELMRKDIEIELVRDTHNDQITAFNVYYSARDPHVAQQVTSELTNLFINENVEVRQQQSEDTTKFLESQLETARKTLAEQETRIREFKGQHVGELPTQQASNLQILSGLQSQLQNEEDALNTAKQQRVYLQTLIDQYRTLRGTSRSADGAPTGLPAIDQELDRLKSQLADLSSRYTDRHPDIRKLRDQITKTEKTRDQIIADLKNKGAGTLTDSSAAVRDAPDLSPGSPMLQLQGQLQANQSEGANRERTIAALKANVNEYQARLNQEPVREQQLADLTRGYDQSKANYDELLKKKNQSEMATRMERLQQGERFRILDPPSLPAKPDFPNHFKFCGIGLVAGLVLGGVVAGGFEMMDDRLYSEKEIKDLMPMAILSEIPDVFNPSDQRKGKRKLWLGWGMAALVVTTVLAGSVFSYLHG
jgi:polysaccharide chain length determinant protein (PEP-CTERM system associated)